MLLFVGLAWLSFKIKDSLSIWTLTLNIFGLILVFLPLSQIGWYLARTMIPISSTLSGPSSSALDLDLQIPQGKPAPDIYYIILDMYTRHDAMEVNLSYDNSSFLNALEQRGFYIADCSQSNYPSTYLSLTSSLNFNYLDALNKQFLPPNTTEETMYPYLQNNSVRRVLKELGYKIIGFESGFSPDEFHNADEYLAPQNDILGELTLGGLNPFESLLMQTSAGELAYAYSTTQPALQPFFDYSYTVYRNRMVFAIKKLPDLASTPGPKFVFVHLLAPHNPFVFGSNGQVLTLNSPFSLDYDLNAATIYDFTAGYTAEVTYLNKQFLNIVDHIIQNSTTPPVIILQGDHGIPRLADWNMTNLSAYYLPEGGEINLYSSISPVNSFRIIFNTYFGGHLPLLEDKACNFSKNGIYGCSLQIDPSPQCSLGNKP
jgi:hypothetical protein